MVFLVSISHALPLSLPSLSPLSLSVFLVSISSSIYVPSFSCHWFVQIANFNLFSLRVTSKKKIYSEAYMT